MRAQKAVDELRRLRGEVKDIRNGFEARPWEMKIESVLQRAFGEDHHLIGKLEKIRYFPDVGRRPSGNQLVDALNDGLRSACAIVDIAISELEDAAEGQDALGSAGFDPDLWAHVQLYIQNENWSAVASQTAIFVEDRVRKWCGKPTGANGQSLVGKGLYGKVFADEGRFRLGREAGEWEGWRALSMGFAQALGNVDRHHIQDRDDAKRYAFGVLGVGSLLLTQLRHQHREDLDLP